MALSVSDVGTVDHPGHFLRTARLEEETRTGFACEKKVSTDEPAFFGYPSVHQPASLLFFSFLFFIKIIELSIL